MQARQRFLRRFLQAYWDIQAVRPPVSLLGLTCPAGYDVKMLTRGSSPLRCEFRSRLGSTGPVLVQSRWLTYPCSTLSEVLRVAQFIWRRGCEVQEGRRRVSTKSHWYVLDETIPKSRLDDIAKDVDNGTLPLPLGKPTVH